MSVLTMNTFGRKVALRVFLIHAGIIVFFWMTFSLKGCFRPKPKPEIITFIEFGAAPPPVQVEAVDEMVEPEQPDPTPTPTPPETVDVPAPVPEPEKIKPPTKVDKPKPPKVVDKPKPPKKNEWKPASVDDIKISQERVEKKPVLTPDQIKKAFEGAATSVQTPAPGPVGNPSVDQAYIGEIGPYFDRYWKHPDLASSASKTVMRIYISKSGAITRRTKILSSGDAVFDQSVEKAVNAVQKVPKPPPGFSFDYVEVEFRIRN